MSEYCDSIERVVRCCRLIDEPMREEYIAELATLRAKAEAWDAVDQSIKATGKWTLEMRKAHILDTVLAEHYRLLDLTPARGEGKE